MFIYVNAKENDKRNFITFYFYLTILTIHNDGPTCKNLLVRYTKGLNIQGGINGFYGIFLTIK